MVSDFGFVIYIVSDSVDHLPLCYAWLCVPNAYILQWLSVGFCYGTVWLQYGSAFTSSLVFFLLGRWHLQIGFEGFLFFCLGSHGFYLSFCSLCIRLKSGWSPIVCFALDISFPLEVFRWVSPWVFSGSFCSVLSPDKAPLVYFCLRVFFVGLGLIKVS